MKTIELPLNYRPMSTKGGRKKTAAFASRTDFHEELNQPRNIQTENIWTQVSYPFRIDLLDYFEV